MNLSSTRMALQRICAIAYQATPMTCYSQVNFVSIRRLRFVPSPMTRTADNSVRMEVHAQKTHMDHVSARKVSQGLGALFRKA